MPSILASGLAHFYPLIEVTSIQSHQATLAHGWQGAIGHQGFKRSTAHAHVCGCLFDSHEAPLSLLEPFRYSRGNRICKCVDAWISGGAHSDGFPHLFIGYSKKRALDVVSAGSSPCLDDERSRLLATAMAHIIGRRQARRRPRYYVSRTP
jgi:hypothetical protein